MKKTRTIEEELEERCSDLGERNGITVGHAFGNPVTVKVQLDRDELDRKIIQNLREIIRIAEVPHVGDRYMIRKIAENLLKIVQEN